MTYRVMEKKDGFYPQRKALSFWFALREYPPWGHDSVKVRRGNLDSAWAYIDSRIAQQEKWRTRNDGIEIHTVRPPVAAALDR